VWSDGQNQIDMWDSGILKVDSNTTNRVEYNGKDFISDSVY